MLFAGKPDVAQPLLYYKNNSATVNAFKSYLTVTETSTGCIDKDTVKIFIHPTPVIFIDTIQPAYCVDDEISLHAFVYYHNLKSLEILSTYNGIKLALSNPVDTLMGLQNAGSSKYHFLMYTINLPKSDTGKHNLQISSTNNLECVYTKDYAINIVRPSKDSTNACSTITANNKGIISEQINVYPNPFSDNISIDITQLSLNKTMLVKITNSHGVTVVRKNINEAELPLDMTKILPGTYVLEIITNEKPYYQKIVKF